MTDYDDQLWHNARTPERRAELARLENQRRVAEALASIAASFRGLRVALEANAARWTALHPDHQQ